MSTAPSYTTSNATLTGLINNYITTKSPTTILITGPPGSGKTTLLNQALTSIPLPVQHILPDSLTNPERTITTAFHLPSAITFDNLDLYVPPKPSVLENRIVASLTYSLSYTPALFIATATSTTALHPAVLHKILHIVPLDALSYQERLQACHVFDQHAEPQAIADVTPGFLWSDMTNLFTRLSTIPPAHRIDALPTLLTQVRPALLADQEVVSTRHTLHGLDEQILQLKQVLHAVFPTTLHSTAARRALDRIGTFCGALIHGPTGCGKTTLARMGKQLVKEHTVNFLEISSTQVVGSVIGEGERKLRRLFMIARAIAPTVVIIDNIDIIAPRRSDHDSGGGVKAFERVLSTLLVLIDGVVKDERKVLVIGTTRDLNLVDGALLRPGRFDLHIPVHPPNEEARIRIMEEFLCSRSIDAVDVGIDPSFGTLSDGWTAPDVLAHVRKKVLQAKANFI